MPYGNSSRRVAQAKGRASSARFSVALAALASLLAASAEGDGFAGRPERLPAFGRDVVTVDDSLALRVNPANLGLLPGAELRWRGLFLTDEALVPWDGNAASLGIALPWGLGFGAELDFVSPSPDAGAFARENTDWLSLGLGFAPLDALTMGFSWQRSFSASSLGNGFSAFTLGVTARPWDVLGVSIVAEDLGNARSDAGTRLEALYHFAAALRPMGTRVVELAGDARLDGRTGSWSPEGTLILGLPFGRLWASAAWEPTPEVGPERHWVLTGGASLDVSFPAGSFEAEGGVLSGDLSSPDTLAGGYASAAVRGFRASSGFDTHFARRLRVEGTPDAGGHIALLRELWALADEPGLEAVVLELRARPARSLAGVEELRDAVGHLRARGKPVACHLEDADGASLYLCAAADRIWMNPAGGLRFAGLSSRYLYFKGLLDKVGVKAEFIRIGPHKSAPESFTRTGPTEVSNRDHIELLYQAETGLTEGVAEGRHLSVAATRERIAAGPYIASEALAAGLVDGLAFDDEEEDRLAELLGHGVSLIDAPLAPLAPERAGRGRSLALVEVAGDMVDGRSRTIPFLDLDLAGSYTLAETLRSVRADANVGAVVLRVDSPGGSAMAADVIWREVELTTRVKPVVVSMGSMAASGGYYIAAPATRIFANPLTLTGSIGIFYGKADIQGLLGKLGVNAVVYNSAPRADAESIFRPFTDNERQALSRKVEQFYDMFLSRVSAGRRLSKAEVHAVAEGRVWTGAQAARHGLVDELGGLRQALAAARVLGHLPESAPIVELPVVETSLAARLLGVKGLHADALAALPAELRAAARALAPLTEQAGDKPLARAELVDLQP